MPSLTRVHAALSALGEDERRRLGVVVVWKCGPHLLTYRQVERTFGLLVEALSKEYPDGMPSEQLQGFVDALIEASVPAEYKDASRSLAIDWTDVESFARPPLQEGGPTADAEASWGHRRGNGPGQRDELFYGFYLGLATMVHEELGTEVPELVRRMLLTSCHVDPVPAFVPVLENMVASGIALGDVLNDSGYSHRVPAHWALPLRALRAQLVMDLHPHDRGKGGTYQGAICFNGSLYCPRHRAPSLASSRWRVGRAQNRPRPTTPAAPSWTVIASPSSTPTTPTGITASCAPPLRASSAARMSAATSKSP